MEIDKAIFGSHDWHRVGLLILKAAELDLYLNEFDDISLNKQNKQVKLYLNDFEFDLVVDYNSDTVKARACNSDGDECYLPVIFKTLDDLVVWVEELQQEE